MDIDDLLHATASQVEYSDNKELNRETTELILASRRKDVEKKAEEIEGLKQDREQRKIFGYCIFGFMCLYMAASLVIVFLCGYGAMILDVSVLITLLTTTLANVIGVFAFVAKYLFPNKYNT